MCKRHVGLSPPRTRAPVDVRSCFGATCQDAIEVVRVRSLLCCAFPLSSVFNPVSCLSLFSPLCLFGQKARHFVREMREARADASTARGLQRFGPPTDAAVGGCQYLQPQGHRPVPRQRAAGSGQRVGSLPHEKRGEGWQDGEIGGEGGPPVRLLRLFF